MSTESDSSATCTFAVVENASSDESPPVDISSLAITKGKMEIFSPCTQSLIKIKLNIQPQLFIEKYKNKTNRGKTLLRLTKIDLIMSKASNVKWYELYYSERDATRV